MIDLITDRTESDVLMGNAKGIYSFTDLNRVEKAVRLASEQAATVGFPLNLQTKTNWGLPGDFSVGEWPVQSQMKRYLNNIAILKNTFRVPIEIPLSMEKLTWKGANNIEKVLEISMSRISGIKQAYRYSGEVFAGEEIL